jgi:AraC-like DNA-binding protein
MLSSSVQRFADPSAYTQAVRHATVQLTITSRGEISAQFTGINLHRLWMQRFWDNLPRITRTESPAGRMTISFRTQTGQRASWNGTEFQPTNAIRHRENESSTMYTSGTLGYGAMSIPKDDVTSIGVLAGCDLMPPRETLIITRGAAVMDRLQRLHAAAGHLAEAAPEIITHPEAARGLEQSLIEAMVGCLTDAAPAGERSARRRHEHIMRRFHRLIEAHPDEALYIPDVCTEIGGAERTLRQCCYEQLGMGPKQFLTTRRMNLVRRDLNRALPTATTVTEVAVQYGFWNLGRFAGEYKSMFGELPSVTLKRTP